MAWRKVRRQRQTITNAISARQMYRQPHQLKTWRQQKQSHQMVNTWITVMVESKELCIQTKCTNVSVIWHHNLKHVTTLCLRILWFYKLITIKWIWNVIRKHIRIRSDTISIWGKITDIFFYIWHRLQVQGSTIINLTNRYRTIRR